ncbi:hypothetical protein GGS21DRAFT_285463 [Xylaria nigripes]|nr:hypothetical protein GGS21DRAFT_285463 [Xylaria nigripes]
MDSMNVKSDNAGHGAHLTPSDSQASASSSNITAHVPVLNVSIRDSTPEKGTESEAQEAGEGRFSSSRTTSAHQALESCRRLRPATTVPTTSPYYHHGSVTYSLSSAPQSHSMALPRQASPNPVYAEAPPAYSPSPIRAVSSERNTSQPEKSINYNTFVTDSTMGKLRLETPKHLRFQLESMGVPGDEEKGSKNVWVVRRRVRRMSPAWLSGNYALLALGVLMVLVVSLRTILFPHSRNQIYSPTLPILSINDEPQIRKPDGPGPGSSFQPSYCQGIPYRFQDQIMALDFGKWRNITFKETPYQRPGPLTVDVGGQINVRRLKGGSGDPSMVLEIATNAPDLELLTSFDADTQTMSMSIPERYEQIIPGQRPCVEIKGTIWVPENAELGTLTIGATHLDILFFDDLSLRATEHAKIASVVGNIRTGVRKPVSYRNKVQSIHDQTTDPAKASWYFDSRIIEVHTTSGNIHGNWPLYDFLGLHTTYGDLNVTITPQEELKRDPKPAVLSLSTISGVISATQPIHEPGRIPPRDYVIDVRSTSGKIHAALAMGANTKVHTISSDMTLDMLPILNIEKVTSQAPARLETLTTSGTITVQVLEPLFFDDNGKLPATSALWRKALDSLDATHKSTSGNLGLRYPQSWEGILYAKTTSGKLVAKGRDLKITKYIRGWPGTKMEARKGGEGKKSTITAHTLVGTVEAVIGDEA